MTQADWPVKEKEIVIQKKPKRFGFVHFFGFGILLYALVVILYYIWGPSTGYLHADSTDTIFWAQASVDSGKIFNPDFFYPALLPFGANLWFVPLVAFGGLTLHTQLIGMTVFLFILTASLIFFFRSLKWQWHESAAATGIALLLFSGSDKLRELFWGHTIYYSLGILLLAVGFGLLARTIRLPDKRLWLILLFVFTALAATNGTQVLALCFLPLIGCLLLLWFFQTEKVRRQALFSKLWKSFVCIFAGTALGGLVLLILRKGGAITAGYAEAYTTWSTSDQWSENFAKLFPDYLKLFGANTSQRMHLFSFDSILLGFLLLCALLVLVLPFIAIFNRKLCPDSLPRLFLLAHLVQTLVLIFFYIFGSLSAAHWRLTPVLGTAILSTLILAREWLKTALAKAPAKKEPYPGTRFGVVVFVILLAAALSVAIKIWRMPADYGNDSQLAKDKQFVLDRGLEYGYGTYWQSNILTLLTDSETKTRSVEIDEKGIYLRNYQLNSNWYKEQAGVDEYFIVLTQAELENLKKSGDWQVLQQRLIDTQTIGTHTFLILNENILDLLD